MEADPIDGVLIDCDARLCTGARNVMDPEIVRDHNGYLGWFNAPGGIKLTASGYACSNFVDDEGGGGLDRPNDPACDSPWDNGE